MAHRTKLQRKAYYKLWKAIKDEQEAYINHKRKRAPGSSRYCQECLDMYRKRERKKHGYKPYNPHSIVGGKPPLSLRYTD